MRMENDRRKRFEAARQSLVEMNRQAWQRGPRSATEASANREGTEALDRLLRNGYEILPNETELARIQAENYTAIGAWRDRPDSEEERWRGVSPEARQRSEAAHRLAREMIRQEWLATGMTAEEYDESDRCSEASGLLALYGYQAIWIEPQKPAETPFRPVAEQELVPQT